MKAKNLKDYLSAWQWHINQLATLAIAADVTYDDYNHIKEHLESWLATAIENQRAKEINHE